MKRSSPLCTLGLALLTGAVALGATTAQAAPTYVRSTVAAPWGQTANEEAMDLVFGVGGWDDLRYETLDPVTLFSPATGFIYMEGSDSNALELAAFLSANQAALEAWVNAGGALFLNAAPNEGGNMDWGFGGVTLEYPGDANNPGTAADPLHPIWNGPNLPCATMFTGGGYAHATVSGPGLVPMILDAGGAVNMAELPAFGSGIVIFGGLTTSNFWDPQPDSLNLRANIIAYLGSGDDDKDGVVNAADNCPDDANPMQEDMDDDGVGDICDTCPDDPLNDEDEDTACDSTDNCLGLANPMQLDDDMDGQGNACDECPGDPDDDIDNDTICGDIDNCPEDVNVNQADDDEDGIGDLCDVCPEDPGNDDDMDGVCAAEDNCPDDANEDQADADGDGIGDVCDEPDSGSTGDPGEGSGDDVPGDETAAPEDTGPGGNDTGPGGGDTTSGGPGSSGDDTAGSSDDGGGCGCRTDDTGSSSWWLALAAGFAFRRRRRAA